MCTPSTLVHSNNSVNNSSRVMPKCAATSLRTDSRVPALSGLCMGTVMWCSALREVVRRAWEPFCRVAVSPSLCRARAGSAGGPDVALDVWVGQSQEAFMAMPTSRAFAKSTTWASHFTVSSIILLLRNPDAQQRRVWATRRALPHGSTGRDGCRKKRDSTSGIARRRTCGFRTEQRVPTPFLPPTFECLSFTRIARNLDSFSGRCADCASGVH
jgi:hypothetical protein